MPILVEPSLPTGSSVSLCGLWLNDAADLSDRVAFEYASGRSPNTQVDLEVRTHVSGRRRLIVKSRAYETYDWKLSWVDEDQRAWLRAHVGRLVCVRDGRGAKWYGVYAAMPTDLLDKADGWDGPNRSNVSVSLTEVSHSESA